MTQLHKFISQRVIQLSRIGSTKVAIQRILKKEGFKTSYTTVSAIVKRYQVRKSFEYARPSGKLPSWPASVPGEINRLMELNNETTARKLQKQLHNILNCDLSITTIKRIRRNLGWVYGNSRYCQFVRQKNMVRRLKFATVALQNQWKFRNVIFTDECTIMLDRHARKSFRKNYEARISLVHLKPRVKHPVKLHVWAGISWSGASSICIFDGEVRMNSVLFCRILREHYLPFQKKLLDMNGTQPVLQMDNDPKHFSGYSTEWLVRHRIRVLEWPAESPDLNAIENVWHQLKTYLRRKKPDNKNDMKQLIKKFWKKYMTVQQCRRYINHIQSVLPAVVERNGAASGM